ncbi:MAG: hypothetical protein ACOVOV_03550, partial [Dolichospermum sp.]
VDFGSSSNNATVVGNITMSGGALTLSTASGGDLLLGGNFTKTGGTFTCNTRSITFNGTTKQIWSSNSTENINNLLLTNTLDSLVLASNVTLPAPTATSTTLNLSNNSKLNIRPSVTLNVVTSSTFAGNVDFGGTGTRVNVAGFFRNSGTSTTANTATNVSATNFIIANGGTYEDNYQTVAHTVFNATWSTGSTLSIIGVQNTAPTNLGQSFHHVTWNCPSQSTAVQLNGGLTSVAGTFSVISTGTGGSGTTPNLRLVAPNGSNYSANFGAINITGGKLNIMGGGAAGGSCVAVINVSGNVILNGNNTRDGSASLEFSASNFSSGSISLNIGGNFSMATGDTVRRSFATSSNITFNGGNGTTQTISQGSGAGTLITNAIAWNVGTGSTSNTLQFLSNVNLGATGTSSFNIRNNATVDFQTFAISGSGSYNPVAGATIATAHASGFSSGAAG